MDIAAANKAARKTHGADIAILVARCPAFGNADTRIHVYGANRAFVAADLARFATGAKVTEERSAPCALIPAPAPFCVVSY